MTEHHFQTNSRHSGQQSDRPRSLVPQPAGWRRWLPFAGLGAVLLLLLTRGTGRGSSFRYSYSSFLSQVQGNHIKTAIIDPTGGVTGTLTNGTGYSSQIPTALGNAQLSDILKAHHVVITGAGAQTSIGAVIFSLLPILVLVGLFVWFRRRGTQHAASGVMGIGASKAKVYDEERPSTRFSDIAGYPGAKREVSEVVDFLQHPEKYRSAGALGPRGVLMVGPPGTGKTLLARAVAGEAKVPFFALTGSSFVEMFVGVGAARVRELFESARKRAPAIIFIDEVDAIGQRRGGAVLGNDEREQTLNQLLAEMDGFDPTSGVVVIAATNRPEVLDPALLRPGRFDRQVEIPLPNQVERTAILVTHARGKHLGPNVDLTAISRGTPGFSGADLANLVNEAAIVAVRHSRDVIAATDLDDARDRILLGPRDASNALLPDEKRAVAIHEAGHALVALCSEHADPVAKVTILPAGQSLGVTQQLPVDERRLYPESYLRDSLAVRLGGRAAELLVLGEASTGAANDLAGATELANRMVRDWGFSQRLGPIGFGSGAPAYLGQQMQSRSYAEGTQLVIDEEVSRLLSEAAERAGALLLGRRASLEAVVDLLLEKETISGDELMEVVREPFGAALAAGAVT
ncbi:MAG: Microtubule-severing ATPase [Acidimicrobiaceae bacterium]|nr:Microtubule-severing ATPase [Acidimicrobiaceae bacterium]